MSSKLFNLDYQDFAKGLFVAVFVVILGLVQQALTAHGFDFPTYDWGGIGKAAIEAGVAYLMKNFISTPDGKVMGRIG